MSEVATDWASEPPTVAKPTPPRVQRPAEPVPLAWDSALGQVYTPVLSVGQVPSPLSEPEVAVHPLGTGMVRPSMGSETVWPLPPVTVGMGEGLGPPKPPPPRPPPPPGPPLPLPPPRPPLPGPALGLDCELDEAVLVGPLWCSAK